MGRHIVVLGGGISGLSCAYYLNVFKSKVLTVKNAELPKITVLERSNHVGGWMVSHKDEKTGAIFEQGPRSLRAQGYEARTTLSLIEELGLANEIIKVTRNSPAGKNRYVYSNGKLNPLPSSLMGVMKVQPPLTKSLMKYLWREMRTKPDPALIGKDESIYSFVCRRFGTEVAEYLADPFMRGIVAGDIRCLSVQALLPRFKAIEDKYGSVIKNFSKIPEQTTGIVENSQLCRKAVDEKWAMFNLRNGIKTLPRAILQNLIDNNVNVQLKDGCKSLEYSDGKMKVYTDSGDCIEADLVISAINAKSLAKLLSKYTILSDKLSQFPSVNVATVSLEYPIKSTEIPQAFGHLIPSREGEKNLGVIYDSVIFPEHDGSDKNRTRLTCMIGGAWFTDVLGSNPSLSQVEDIAVRSIAKQLNITKDPVTVKANILKEAIPQYPVGHLDNINKVFEEVEREDLQLNVIGPSFNQPGGNHCIHNAKVLAQKVLECFDLKDYQTTIGSRTRLG